MNPFDDIRDFHEKFALAANGAPRALGKQEQEFRIKCMREELHEYEDAVANNDLAEQFDALIDLSNFALGTAYRQNFPFLHGWSRVHDANMTKERSPDTVEVTKPEGWQAPDLNDLLLRHELYDSLKDNTGLITIDGVDGSGKTTLAKRIAQLYGGEYIHLTWSPRLAKVMNEYRMSAIMYATALAQDRVVVLERPWLCHPIYSAVYRNDRTEPAYKEWREMTEDAQDVGILALPENGLQWYKDYKHSAQTRDEHYSAASDTLMLQVYKYFWDIYEGERSGLDVEPLDKSRYVRYDYQTINPAQDMDEWILALTKPLLGKK